MFSISKMFTFSASHQLAGLPEEHPCSRLHGHNYRVELVLQGEPNSIGFVYDYRDLDCFAAWLKETMDHRHLNDVMGDWNPTAELLAFFIFHHWYEKLPLAAVRVSETERTWATYHAE